MAAVGCGSSTDASDGQHGAGDKAAVEKAAAEFAPMVSFASGEKRLPMNAEWFLARSTLRFADGTCGDRHVASGDELADGPDLTSYQEAPRDSRAGRGPCKPPTRDAIAATVRTRPHDFVHQPSWLGVDEGFFLDLRDTARKGDAKVVRRGGQKTVTGVDAYYESKPARVGGEPGLRLIYWFLHGMYEPAGFDGELVDELVHEGDWVHTTMLLQRDGDGYEPRSVRFYSDGADREAAWKDLEHVDAQGRRAKDGTHPVLYSAPGDHVLYPEVIEAGWTATLLDGTTVSIENDTQPCPYCILWPTWKRLEKVRAKPWYGYGGAWGNTGYIETATGSLGPYPKLTAADGQ